MKKILCFLFTILASLIFSNKVNAISCIYENQYAGIKFVVYETSGDVHARPLSEYTKNGETKDNQDVWEVVKDAKGKEIKSLDSCYSYMYYDINYDEKKNKDKENHIYLSNSNYEDLEFDTLMTLKTYKENNSRVILDDLMCTYENGNSSYAIRISKEKNLVGTYSVWKDNEMLYEKDYKSNILHMLTGTSYNIDDKFNIRTFYSEERDSFHCPPSITVATQVSTDITYVPGSEPIYTSTIKTILGFEAKEDFEGYIGLFGSTGVSTKEYILQKNASYINSFPAENVGNMCSYMTEGSKDSNDWDFFIQEYSKTKEEQYGYSMFIQETDKKFEHESIDITGVNLNKIHTDCSKLPVLYTNCMEDKVCKISESNFTGATKYVSNTKINSEDYDSYMEDRKEMYGEEFKKNICSIAANLKQTTSDYALNNLSKLVIYDSNGSNKQNYNILNLDCSKWGYQVFANCNSNNCSYELTSELLNMNSYCNNIYYTYTNNSSSLPNIARKEECLSYKTFYDELVAAGIIQDLNKGCEILSTDIQEKLSWILDLIKIAGPILALGLGTLDFIKAIASGDADKEMKTAFKRFTTRIIAAALLFVIPVILAFMMDIFLGNQDGYNEDNPFCNIVDWKD